MFHASIDIVEPKSIIAFQLRLPPEAISRTAMSARSALQKASSRYWAKYTLQASPFFSRKATVFGISAGSASPKATAAALTCSDE